MANHRVTPPPQRGRIILLSVLAVTVAAALTITGVVTAVG